MFFKRNKVETVHASEYTDYSERFADLEKMRREDGYATKKHVAIASAVPVAAAVGYIGFKNSMNALQDLTSSNPSTISAPINVMSSLPQSIDSFTPVQVNTTPTPEWGLTANNPFPNSPFPDNPFADVNGFDMLADISLQLFTLIAQPFIKFMVALSFPIASIIMLCACFMLMFSMKEKALSTMMFCGIGYVLIQFSPFLLQIFNTIGQQITMR